MYRCARISKPVGTPETLHDQTRRCPPSLCTRSIHTRQGRRLNAEPIARARVCTRLLPCIIRTASREPPLRERRVSPIFPDRVRVSFYLSERVELSNTARLSLSATSSPPFPRSPSLPPSPRVGPTTNALSPDRCTLRLENSRARLCTRASPPDRSLSYQLSSIFLPSTRSFHSSPRRSARRCARETVNSLDRPELGSSKA